MNKEKSYVFIHFYIQLIKKSMSSLGRKGGFKAVETAIIVLAVAAREHLTKWGSYSKIIVHFAKLYILNLINLYL